MEILNIELAKTIPTTDNPRVKPKKTDPSIKELAGSIQEQGLLQPVLVRPHPTKKGFYDLRAGHRRFVAHQALNRTTIDAICREMDDTTALEVTVLENLQRENLTPIEEGKSVQLLLESGKDPKAIASDIGKHVSWVHRRARLTKLSEAWSKEIANTESFCANWSAGHFELIARFEPDVQDRVLSLMNRSTWLYKDKPLTDIEDLLDDFMCILKKAPWELSDAELVKKVGPCSECSNRTHVNPELFATGDAKVDKEDRCLDRKCFEGKGKKWLAGKEGDLREKYPDLLIMTSGNTNSAKSVPVWKCTACKKTDKGAKPVMIGDTEKAGALRWVKIRKDSTTTQAPKKLSLKERKQTLETKRWEAVGEDLSNLLRETGTEQIAVSDDDMLIRGMLLKSLAAVFGVQVDAYYPTSKDSWKKYDEIIKEWPNGPTKGAALLWDGVKDIISEGLWRQKK